MIHVATDKVFLIRTNSRFNDLVHKWVDDNNELVEDEIDLLISKYEELATQMGLKFIWHNIIEFPSITFILLHEN